MGNKVSENLSDWTGDSFSFRKRMHTSAVNLGDMQRTVLTIMLEMIPCCLGAQQSGSRIYHSTHHFFYDDAVSMISGSDDACSANGNTR